MIRDLGVRIASVASLRVLAMLAGLGTTLLLAHWLGAAEFGRYSFAFSVAVIATLPFVQGLPVLAVREVSRATAGERPRKIWEVHSFARRIMVCLSLVSGSIIALMAAGNQLDLFRIDIGLVAAAAALPLLTMSATVHAAILRGLGRDVAGHVGDLLVKPIGYFALLLVVGIGLGVEPSAATAMALFCVAAALSLATSLGLLGRQSLAQGGVVHWRPWLRSLLPLSSVAGMQMVNSQTAIVVLGIMGEPSEVGVYRVAASLALQTSFLLTVTNAVAAPRFAKAFRDGRIDSLVSLNRKAGMVAVAFGAAVFIVLALVGPRAIPWALGEDFEGMYWPLLVLSGSHVLTLFAGSTNVLLNMIGRERIVLRAAVLALTSNVLFNLVLVPVFGVMGAAMGTALSLLTWRLYLSRQLAKTLAQERERLGHQVTGGQG